MSLYPIVHLPTNTQKVTRNNGTLHTDLTKVKSPDCWRSGLQRLSVGEVDLYSHLPQ